MTFNGAKNVLDRARRMSVHEQRGNRVEITEALKGALLVQHLTPEQRQELEQHNYFTVKTHRGNFRLLGMKTKNVVKLCFPPQGGAPPVEEQRFCVGPFSDGLPLGDFLLTQKLALESDTNEFLSAANTRFRTLGGVSYVTRGEPEADSMRQIYWPSNESL